MGLTESLAGGYIGFIGSELKLATAFLLILVVLLIKPTGLFGAKVVQRGMSDRHPGPRPAHPRRQAGGRWPSCAAVLLYLPQYYAQVEVERFTRTIVFAMAILGLNLLTGFSGQISLGHGAFFGIGAYTTAILVADYGWPHLLTVVAAAVICFLAGFVAGLPALRIRGLYLGAHHPRPGHGLPDPDPAVQGRHRRHPGQVGPRVRVTVQRDGPRPVGLLPGPGLRRRHLPPGPEPRVQPGGPGPDRRAGQRGGRRGGRRGHRPVQDRHLRAERHDRRGRRRAVDPGAAVPLHRRPFLHHRPVHPVPRGDGDRRRGQHRRAR